MGPPPQCSGFIFGDWCVCNIFSLGCIRCSLVWSWAVPHRTAGDNIWFRSPGARFLLAGDSAATRSGGQHTQLCAQDGRAQMDRWKWQMGDLQRVVARNVFRCPLREGPDGRWKLGQVAQRVGALAVQSWRRLWCAGRLNCAQICRLNARWCGD